MNKKPQSRPGKVMERIVTLKKIENEVNEVNDVKNISESGYHKVLAEHKSHCMQFVPKKKKTISDYLTIKMPFWIIVTAILTYIIADSIISKQKPKPEPVIEIINDTDWELEYSDTLTFSDNGRNSKLITLLYNKK